MITLPQFGACEIRVRLVAFARAAVRGAPDQRAPRLAQIAFCSGGVNSGDVIEAAIRGLKPSSEPFKAKRTW